MKLYYLFLLSLLLLGLFAFVSASNKSKSNISEEERFLVFAEQINLPKEWYPQKVNAYLELKEYELELRKAKTKSMLVGWN